MAKSLFSFFGLGCLALHCKALGSGSSSIVSGPGSGDQWRWTEADTQVFVSSAVLIVVCVVLSAVMLYFSGFSSLQQRKQQQEGVAGSSQVIGKLEQGESVPLAHSELGTRGPRAVFWRASLWLIGFMPLVCCVAVGESLGSLLGAMMWMHWGCMTVLPIAYTTLRSLNGFDYASKTKVFYARLLAEQRRNFIVKSLRGTVVGVLVFLLILVGHSLVKCSTHRWLFCLRTFQKPLDDYGFRSHSMSFGLLAAVYFSLWNPIAEELFWRVFLSREFTLDSGDLETIGEDPRESVSSQQTTTDHFAQGVYSGVTAEHRALADIYRGDRSVDAKLALVRWQVCAMYATYHIWPIKVLFRQVWGVYVVGSFIALTCLGRVFLAMRESGSWGLPAAYVVHASVDAAFAVICFMKL
eukprot:TRINITY_DN35737_c0_g1_i1.p1 TRINITY_DN35737_c0_g1~~TRINITY_DN35737_c0_g1_i1.p1  ORF type:complete len:430 (-),score=56.80 TRINITY_DN35737_c0_g1_i1:128-1357(-)